MATTQILPFSTLAAGSGGNRLTPTAYAALTTLLADGFQSGVAESNQVNTVLAQASFMAAGLANFCVSQGVSVPDDGNLTNLVSEITSALTTLITNTTPGTTLTIPTQTKTGAGYSWLLADSTYLTKRSNSGLAMADTLPGTSGAIAAGSYIYLMNVDSAGSDVVGVGSGGSIAVGNNATANSFTVAPGETWLIVSQGSGAWTAQRISENSITVVKNQTFTTSGTYTPSAGMVFADIQIIGGGGAGGGVPTSTGAAGGGGSSGAISKGIFTKATIGSSQTVTIGAGGTGSAGAAGGNGGATSVGSLLTAPGGNGGAEGTTNSGGYVPYVAAGGGLPSAGTGGYLNGQGNAGGFGQGMSWNNSYFASGYGGAGLGGYGGGAPVVHFTFGGDSVVSNGNNGQANGSGGSGGGCDNGNVTASTGGNGGAGLVIITEYCSI